MNNDIPKSLDDYEKWLIEKHNVELSNKYENHYLTFATKIQQKFSQSPFWNELSSSLIDFDNEYYTKHGYRLLIKTEAPKIEIKTYESFLGKTLRKNCYESKN